MKTNKKVSAVSKNKFQRKIFFHCGAGKTGSSALQAFFSANKLELKNYGISYEHSPDVFRQDEITSGNGGSLLTELQATSTSEHTLDLVVESYFLNTLEAICSSELLSWLSEIDWLRIKTSFERLHIEVKCVSFIRDIEPCYVSAYHQMIKRHGESRSFEEFVDTSPTIYNHLKHIKEITKVFGKEKVCVLHYEANRKSMDEAFFNAIERSCNSLNRSILEQKINRSLSNCELRILKKINRISNDAFSQEISDMLIYARPNLRAGTEKNVDADVSLIMGKRHAEDVDWINNNYFDQQPNFTIEPKQHNSEIVSVIHDDEILKIHDDVLMWCINKLAILQADKTTALEINAARLIQIIVGQLPEIDHGYFDADFYIKANPDVAIAGVDPNTHYFGNGMFEGRLPSENIDVFLKLAWKARGDMLRYGVSKLGQQSASQKIELTSEKESFDRQVAELEQAHMQELKKIQEDQKSNLHIINTHNNQLAERERYFSTQLSKFLQDSNLQTEKLILECNVRVRELETQFAIRQSKTDKQLLDADLVRQHLDALTLLQSKYESNLLLLVEREKALGVQFQELMDNFAKLTDSQSREHNVHLQELFAQLVAKQENLDTQTLQATEKEKHHLSKITEIETELNALLNMRTWRWTAPFRAISNWLN